jgi:cytochrome c
MIPHMDSKTRTSASRILASTGIALLAMTAAVSAADIPPGCSAATNAEFKTTTLVSRQMGIDEPIKMDFDLVGKDLVDIYWVERKGAVRKYDATSKALVELGTIVHNDEFESGVTGILLDKGFKTNKRMFIYYAFGNASAFEFRLSRFVLGGNGKLDLSSEKILLKIPAGFKKMHTGGGMAWDQSGNIFLTVGENEGSFGSSGNTNDLRGKILRIHPEEDGTYTVPDGNLFPKGTAKTKPEIYVMGVRNAYSLSYDPVLKGVVWGDVGPDLNAVTEEDNFAAAPGNYGYPFFAGNQVPVQGGGDPNAPKNTSNLNTGLVDLPPAHPGTYSYQQACAVTGPIYRYDGSNPSARRFPPQFDGRWFVTDCNNGLMDTLVLNAKADGLARHGRIFSATRLALPLDMKFGPDGALYIINYAGWFSAASETAILRMEYTGSCLPVGIVRGQSEEREASRRRNLALLRRGGLTLIPWEGLRLLNGRSVAEAP